MTAKKIDKETILIGALIEIKEIAEEVLGKFAVSTEIAKPKTEEVPEIISEEDADLSRPIVSKVSFGEPEEKVEFAEEFKKTIEEAIKKDEPITISHEGQPRKSMGDIDYIELADFQEKVQLQMQKQNEIATVKQEMDKGKNIEEAVKSVAVPEKKQGQSEMTIKPANMETTSICPKCNSKLNHTSKIEKIGEGFFAINTATCTNKGKKSFFKKKVISEPCDYMSQSTLRID